MLNRISSAKTFNSEGSANFARKNVRDSFRRAENRGRSSKAIEKKRIYPNPLRLVDDKFVKTGASVESGISKSFSIAYEQMLRGVVTDALAKYQYGAEDNIEDIVTRNIEMIPVLRQAVQQISSYFPDADLILRSENDPAFGVPPTIVLIIRTGLDPKTTRQSYHDLLNSWWKIASMASGHRIHLVTAYK